MPDSELDILKTAIVNEMEALQFYILAAQLVKDPETKEAFTFLADEEEMHKDRLTGLYRKIAHNQPVGEVLIEETPSPHIFEPGKAKPESSSLEVSLFHICILMEKASIDFYRQAAENSRREEVKALCRQLADWENSHLEILQRIYDHLKEEWWRQQGFSAA
ncbi:rubrerythrin [Desulfofundulus thermobenzoicus]|uniref:Rubrerythrin n=1 Tax=Desulfofundulus thermobenzoicus TaxID=29376 RepID=A0A6N7INI4_9FIRM|nr:ferritin family protein [Desulfofundulus thermobenzoicus]MQL51159.1 rubrerythrin [Desulfofundulus thermobenzoicus]HHW44917.1 ferritin family protein [Desulfotomaculum sp.]